MVIPCTSQAADNNVLGNFGAKLEPAPRRDRLARRGRGRLDLVVADAAAQRHHPEARQRHAATTASTSASRRARSPINADTFATSADGIFAVGDFVTGPATIIEAAGLGRRCARAVDRWLAGVRGEELEELPVINRATITQALEHDMP